MGLIRCAQGTSVVYSRPDYSGWVYVAQLGTRIASCLLRMT